MYEDLKTIHPSGIRTGIFCSGGRRDDHCATPPGQHDGQIIAALNVRSGYLISKHSTSDKETYLTKKEKVDKSILDGFLQGLRSRGEPSV
jgi:hypothetical protein